MSMAATIACRSAPGTSSPPRRTPTSLSRPAPSWRRRRWRTCWRSTMRRSAQVFAGSPIKRIGRDRMVRNAAIVAGNSGAANVVAPLTRVARRSLAGGARCGGVGARAAGRARSGARRGRADETVREEWTSPSRPVRPERSRGRARAALQHVLRLRSARTDEVRAPPPSGSARRCTRRGRCRRPRAGAHRYR